MQYNFWETFLGHNSSHAVRDILFYKFLVDTCPFVGSLIPLFWTSCDVSSGATPADLLVASMAAEPFSSSYFRTFQFPIFRGFWNVVVFINARIHSFSWGGGGLMFSVVSVCSQGGRVPRVTTTHWPPRPQNKHTQAGGWPSTERLSFCLLRKRRLAVRKRTNLNVSKLFCGAPRINGPCLVTFW